MVENTFLKFYIYIHMYNTYKTPLYARCKFHSRVSYTNFTIPGSWRAGCRWQLLPFLLYVSPPLSLQRSLPRIQAVLNREKWIFWSERISTSNPFLLRHCLLSPWWFMGGRVSSVLREKQYLLDAWLAYSRTSLRIEIAGGSVTMLKTSLIPLVSTPWRGGNLLRIVFGTKSVGRVIWMETLWKGNFV